MLNESFIDAEHIIAMHDKIEKSCKDYMNNVVVGIPIGDYLNFCGDTSILPTKLDDMYMEEKE